MTGTGDLPEVQLIKLLDLNVDRRTKQHIEILRCLGLVESVVIPESGDRPVPLAPTVASRLKPASLSFLHVLALCAHGTFSCWLIGSDLHTLIFMAGPTGKPKVSHPWAFFTERQKAQAFLFFVLLLLLLFFHVKTRSLMLLQ